MRKLHILWTNADVHTSRFMVMMYATNSMFRDWWDDVTVIIWGSTAKLVAEDQVIQESIAVARHAGVRFSACVDCASQLGVLDKLEALNIETVPWGDSLTELLQSGQPMLTV